MTGAGTLVWDRSWCWAAGDTESSRRRNSSDAIAPGAGTAPLGISSAPLASPPILNLGFASTFSCTPEEIHSPGAEGRQKMYKCSCELLSGSYCWYWLPPETSTLATDTPGFVFVGRKDLFSLPQSFHFSACFCQTALVLQVGQCYRSTCSETMEIWRIYGYSGEAVKYDGKYFLSKAACCDSCVLCSPCP